MLPWRGTVDGKHSFGVPSDLGFAASRGATARAVSLRVARVAWWIGGSGEAPHPDAHAIVAVRADELAGALAALGAARLSGVLLSADPRARGLRGALGQLRRVAAPQGVRIGVVLLGATQHEAPAAFRRLEAAAQRQLGREVEALGSLCADEATRRALLRGRSTLELEPDAESARQILALCERLRGAPREAA